MPSSVFVAVIALGLLAPDAAYADVGPLAGFAFLGSLVAILVGFLAALMSLFGVAVPGRMTGKVLGIEHPEPAAAATDAPA